MKKKQLDKIITFILNRLSTCPHDNYNDCPKCVRKWIRKGIRESEKIK